ncbi:MAG: hypothetical protein H7233_16960 [Pseudorhodobacter sp.]|nr:hypothetical protein [Frankiaceae bacterium]
MDRPTPTLGESRVGPGLPHAEAELVLDDASTGEGEVGTHAARVLVSSFAGLDGALDGALDGDLDGDRLRQLAQGFLDNLATAAETRNRAA